LIFYAATILVVVLIGSVFAEIVSFYISHPSNTAILAARRAFQHLTLRILLSGAGGIVGLWFLLSFLARHTLVVLGSLRIWHARFLEYLIRLGSSVPTLILGNELIKLTDKLGLHPKTTLSSTVFVTAALTLIGLPTVLNIGQTVLKDQDNKPLNQALSLGVSRVLIGKKILLPSVRRSFNMAVTLSLGRIVIEAYIVIQSSVFERHAVYPIKDAQDVMSVFNAVYSSMTVESNTALLIVLFVFALLGNLWVQGAGLIQQK
jgi:ABC-type phosphate transport system permease subunit